MLFKNPSTNSGPGGGCGRHAFILLPGADDVVTPLVLAFSDVCRLNMNFMHKISALAAVLKFVIPVFSVLPFPVGYGLSTSVVN